MTSSIESVLKLLTSDSTATEQLINLTKTVTEKNTEENNDIALQQNNETDKLQLKINLINAIIPLLSDKATEQAQFLIKLLSVISVINQLKNTEN